MKCKLHSDLENAIWKQLPFSHDHSIFNKKTWRDFVLYVKESGNAFSTIIEPTWIMSDVGKKMLQMFLVFYANLYKKGGKSFVYPLSQVTGGNLQLTHFYLIKKKYISF